MKGPPVENILLIPSFFKKLNPADHCSSGIMTNDFKIKRIGKKRVIVCSLSHYYLTGIRICVNE